MADLEGAPKADAVERTLRPDEIETSKRLLRTGHISDDRADALRKPARLNSRLKLLDARRVAIDCQDGARGQFGKLQGLSADSAPEVEDRRKIRQLVTKTKSSCGARTVAGALAGQAFIDLKEDFPETGTDLFHGFRGLRAVTQHK